MKTAVFAAPLAALLLVPAATADGAAVFLVAPGDAGVTVERQQVTGGGSAGRVTLRGARLGDDRVLGSPAAGPGITEWLVAHGTVGLCALQLGVVERALELTSAYARDRVQFGRPIGSFQAVTQRLADAYIDVEAVRLTMWQAAWQLAAGLPGGTEVATAKFWAADAGHRVAHTAVHVHGGVGIDMDYPLHRYFTAAKRAEFALGGATSQLRRIGAALARDTGLGHVLVAAAVAVPQLTQVPGDKLLVEDLAGPGAMRICRRSHRRRRVRPTTSSATPAATGTATSAPSTTRGNVLSMTALEGSAGSRSTPTAFWDPYPCASSE